MYTNLGKLKTSMRMVKVLSSCRQWRESSRTSTYRAYDPWAEMTKAQRRAFQHSYSRHADELGLPKWAQGNAEELRTQFNNVVGHIRETGTYMGTKMKPFNGQSTRVNYYESNLQGTKYYYYETQSGQFISAGKVR